jgi:DNA-binding XRE family transcriptional regulator
VVRRLGGRAGPARNCAPWFRRSLPILDAPIHFDTSHMGTLVSFILQVERKSDNSMCMKIQPSVTMTHCPNCGTRLVPTPTELKRWRVDAGLNQREMGKQVDVSPGYIAYLESGKRSPSAKVIARYWRFIPSQRPTQTR